MIETTHSNLGAYRMTRVHFGDIEPGRLSGRRGNSDWYGCKRHFLLIFPFLGKNDKTNL